jgi:hypothetical protein
MNKVIKEANKQHHNRLIAKSHNRIKTWNIMKNKKRKMHLPEQSLSLLINNENVMDPKIADNAFNTLLTAAEDKPT